MIGTRVLGLEHGDKVREAWRLPYRESWGPRVRTMLRVPAATEMFPEASELCKGMPVAVARG